MLTVLLFSLLGIFQAYGSFLPIFAQHNDALRIAVGHLSPRQTNGTDFPDQCKPDCVPVDTELNKDGCTLTECCNADFMNELYRCLKCFGEAVGLTDFSHPQETGLDSLYQQCTTAGYTVPRLFLPGMSPTSSAPAPTTTRAIPPPVPQPPASQPPAPKPMTHPLSADASSHSSTPSPTHSPIFTPAPGLVTLNAPVTLPTDQLTVTSIDLQGTSVPQPVEPSDPTVVDSNSGGVSRHLPAPRISQLTVLSVMFSGFAYLLM